MSVIRVAVVNWTRLDEVEVARGIDAMQEQLDEDFGPVWRVDAELKPIPSVPVEAWPGYWALILLDERRRGEHSAGDRALSEYADLRHTQDGHPLATVAIDEASAPRWTHPASRALLEMLVDPDGNAAVLRDSGEPQRKRVCEPCRQTGAGYARRGRLVSDFVHPAWFGSATLGATDVFDQRRLIRRPFETLTGVEDGPGPIATDVTRPPHGGGRGVWPPP